MGSKLLAQAVCEEVLPGAGANDHVTIGFAFLVRSWPHISMPRLRETAERHGAPALCTGVLHEVIVIVNLQDAAADHFYVG
jgi:hypothetical protein